MSGLHAMRGAWMTMIHGHAVLIYDHQGGRRRDPELFNRHAHVHGTPRTRRRRIRVTRHASTDPLMGKSGYPLLFQTGETANGRDPLIDRQHPHDLLMEAAATYSLNLSPHSSLFVYAGLPGEPALGPNAFMHRLSGMDEPEATAVASLARLDAYFLGRGDGRLHLENSQARGLGVHGREPDQNRYNIEARSLDSYAARVSYNPTRDWSLQGSFGRLASPEQLQPGVGVRRSTASASYNAPLGRWWQTTLAWGRNAPSAGPAMMPGCWNRRSTSLPPIPCSAVSNAWPRTSCFFPVRPSTAAASRSTSSH